MNDDIIELALICEKYFGLKPEIAARKVAQKTLSIPAFRLSGRKGPLFVRKADLAALADTRAEEASRAQIKKASAGAA